MTPAPTTTVLPDSFDSYKRYKDIISQCNDSNQSLEYPTEGVMLVEHMILSNSLNASAFETILKTILKVLHECPGHLSTCVVKPRTGDFTYTTIIKFNSSHTLQNLEQCFTLKGFDFATLLQTRDAFLSTPPSLSIESSYDTAGTWIERHTGLVSHDITPSPDSCENPHGLLITARFITPKSQSSLFRHRYQRNNKKGGQKNLRCFPNCTNGGTRHVKTGFCGDSIKVNVVMSRVTTTGDVKVCPFRVSNVAIKAFCRFIPNEQQNSPEFKIGSEVEEVEILKFVREKEANPLGELIPGMFKGAASEGTFQSAVFEFNDAKKAWHYGWNAPRGSSENTVTHVVQVIFFKNVPNTSRLYCLDTLSSAPFSIYSSRRARGKVAAQREAAVVVLEDVKKVKREEEGSPGSVMSSFTIYPELFNGSTMHDSNNDVNLLDFNDAEYRLRSCGVEHKEDECISEALLPWGDMYGDIFLDDELIATDELQDKSLLCDSLLDLDDQIPIALE